MLSVMGSQNFHYRFLQLFKSLPVAFEAPAALEFQAYELVGFAGLFLLA